MAYKDDWREVSSAIQVAVKREQNVRVGSTVNWGYVHNLVLEAILFAGCVMLDNAGMTVTPRGLHILELYEVRNAIVHNGGDITQNNRITAKSEIEDYINNNKHLLLNTDPDPSKIYIRVCPFEINGNIVKVNDNISHFINLLLP